MEKYVIYVHAKNDPKGKLWKENICKEPLLPATTAVCLREEFSSQVLGNVLVLMPEGGSVRLGPS